MINYFKSLYNKILDWFKPFDSDFNDTSNTFERYENLWVYDYNREKELWYPENCKKVEIKLLDGGKLPEKAHIKDTCYDVYAREEAWVAPGEIKRVPLGFVAKCEKGWGLQLRPRSGLGSMGITIANSPGTVDNGYRNEVCALVWNMSPQIGNTKNHLKVHEGMRIAQICIEKVYDINFVEVESFDDDSFTAFKTRGKGGFGSTGN